MERVHFAMVGVNAQHVESGLREYNCQGHAHIAHAQNADLRRFVLQLLDENFLVRHLSSLEILTWLAGRTLSPGLRRACS